MNDWADVKRVPAAELAAMVGRSFVSRWMLVDQARIDAFAKVTEDEQFIHVDPERAAETVFGGTVAHGFLTLSLLSAMAYSALPRIEGAVHGVNYGFDRVRPACPFGKPGARAFYPEGGHAPLGARMAIELRGQRRDRRGSKARACGDLADDAGDGVALTIHGLYVIL
jgi:acyl dehydratase